MLFAQHKSFCIQVLPWSPKIPGSFNGELKGRVLKDWKELKEARRKLKGPSTFFCQLDQSFIFCVLQHRHYKANRKKQKEEKQSSLTEITNLFFKFFNKSQVRSNMSSLQTCQNESRNKIRETLEAPTWVCPMQLAISFPLGLSLCQDKTNFGTSPQAHFRSPAETQSLCFRRSHPTDICFWSHV